MECQDPTAASPGAGLAIRMNSGEGDTSYAMNSSFQLSMILSTKPYVEEAMRELLSSAVPEQLTVADLGCGSGPNSLRAVAMVLDAAAGVCKQTGRRSPDFQAFLNDLVGNDFNTVLKAVPAFHEENQKREDGPASCFVHATPGSFYGRLFANGSLDFAYSSFSLHWLSQVPLGLSGEKASLNKGNLCLTMTSPVEVFEAYRAQFRRDFKAFIGSRSEEIVPGGRMVLTLKARRLPDPFEEEGDEIWDWFADALRDLMSEGAVEEEEVYSFNMPLYEPHVEEVREIIEAEGSFHIMKLEPMPFREIGSDGSCSDMANLNLIVNTARAYTEPILASHFGPAMMDALFEKFKGRIVLNETEGAFLVASLCRKS